MALGTPVRKATNNLAWGSATGIKYTERWTAALTSGYFFAQSVLQSTESGMGESGKSTDLEIWV